MQGLGPGKVKERLVNADRLHQRCQILYHRADLMADALVLFHVRADDHGLGTTLERLEHGHGRAHAGDSRDVTTGRNDAAPAAADDHRPPGDGRIVALFHAGVKGIAIDMGQGQGS